MVQRPYDWAWSSYLATVGKVKPHACLTTDWVLGQFSGKRGKAEKEYRNFVQWGIGKKTIWTEVRGQALLGEDAFVDKLVDHLKKHKNIPEIPRSQRFSTRPPLEKIFPESVRRKKGPIPTPYTRACALVAAGRKSPALPLTTHPHPVLPPEVEGVADKDNSIGREKQKRDMKIAEAVQKHGYMQSEVARHLSLHTATVSRLVWLGKNK